MAGHRSVLDLNRSCHHARGQLVCQFLQAHFAADPVLQSCLIAGGNRARRRGPLPVAGAGRTWASRNLSHTLVGFESRIARVVGRSLFGNEAFSIRRRGLASPLLTGRDGAALSSLSVNPNFCPASCAFRKAVAYNGRRVRSRFTVVEHTVSPLSSKLASGRQQTVTSSN